VILEDIHKNDAILDKITGLADKILMKGAGYFFEVETHFVAL